MTDPLPVGQVMTAPAADIHAGVAVREAARMMVEEGVSYLVVVRDRRRVGIVTEHDVTAVVAAGRDPALTRVKEAASDAVVTVAREAPVERAAELMARREIDQVPVVELDGDATDGGRQNAGDGDPTDGEGEETDDVPPGPDPGTGEVVGVVTATDVSAVFPAYHPGEDWLDR